MRCFNGCKLNTHCGMCLQPGAELFCWAGNRTKLWSVHRRDFDALRQQAGKFLRRQVDRRHRPREASLHQTPPRRHDAERILEAHDAGEMRGDVLADAVTDHGLRDDAPLSPQAGEGIFGRRTMRAALASSR